MTGRWLVRVVCAGLLLAGMQWPTQNAVLAGTDSEVTVEQEAIVITLESQRTVSTRGGVAEYFAGCSFFKPGPGDNIRVWWEEQGFQDFSLAESESDLLHVDHSTVIAGYCPPSSGVGFGPRQVPTTWWLVGEPGSAATRSSLLERAVERIPFPAFEIESAPDGLLTPFLTNLAVGLRPSAPVEVLSGDANLAIAPLTVVVVAQPVEVAFLSQGEVLTTCTQPFPTDAELHRARKPRCSFTFKKPTVPETTIALQLRVTYETQTRCTPTCVGDPSMQLGDITVTAVKPVRVVESLGLRG